MKTENTVRVGKINFVDYGEDDFSPHAGTLNGTWFMFGISFDDEKGDVLVHCDRDRMDSMMSDGELCRMSQLFGKTVEFDVKTRHLKLIK